MAATKPSASDVPIFCAHGNIRYHLFIEARDNGTSARANLSSCCETPASAGCASTIANAIIVSPPGGEAETRP